MNSRSKGKRGELSFAKYVVEQFGGVTINNGESVEARRGQQFRGGEDSPDVTTNLPIHFEVKNTNRLRIHPAMEQAISDGGDRAVVAYKANHKPWLAILPMDSFLKLIADQIGDNKDKT